MRLLSRKREIEKNNDKYIEPNFNLVWGGLLTGFMGIVGGLATKNPVFAAVGMVGLFTPIAEMIRTEFVAPSISPRVRNAFYKFTKSGMFRAYVKGDEYMVHEDVAKFLVANRQSELTKEFLKEQIEKGNIIGKEGEKSWDPIYLSLSKQGYKGLKDLRKNNENKREINHIIKNRDYTKFGLRERTARVVSEDRYF